MSPKLEQYAFLAMLLAVLAGILYVLFVPFPFYFQIVIYVSVIAFIYFFWNEHSIRLPEWFYNEDREIGVLARYEWVFIIAGLLLVLSGILFLEHRQHFYFVEADNHREFFPLILYSARSLFDQGVFSNWDGFQFLGIPTASMGNSPLTYPITYIAYAIARYVLGNEFATMEVYAALHMLGGYVAFYIALRALRIHPFISMSAAFGYVLIGFFLIAGRSWFGMLSPALWLPVLFLSSVKFALGSHNMKWVAGTGLAIGLFFHAGHVQMWLYGVIFWVILTGLALIYHRKNFLPLICLCASCGLLGLAIASPLLVVQYLQTIGIPRSSWGDNLTNDQWDCMLLSAWGGFCDHFNGKNYLDFKWNLFKGAFSYISIIYLPMFCLLFGLLFAHLVRRRFTPLVIVLLGWLAGALIFYIYGLGNDGGLWAWLLPYPPFSKFNHPFRILPYFAILVTAGGAFFLEAARRRYPSIKRPVYILTICAMAFTFVHLSMSRTSFNSFTDIPYPKLLEELKFLQYSNVPSAQYTRIKPRPKEDHMACSTNTQIEYYPTLYQINSALGYVGKSPEKGLPQLRFAANFAKRDKKTFQQEYGIRWIILPVAPKWAATAAAEQLRMHKISVRNCKIFAIRVDNKNTKPLVFRDIPPYSSVPFTIHPDGLNIVITPSKNNTRYVAGFLYFPWFTGYSSNGEEVPVFRDEIGRMTFSYDGSADMVYLRYSPPWHYGVYLGFALMLLAITLWRVSATLVLPKDVNKKT